MVWAPTAMADSIEECEYHPSFLTDHQYLLVKFHLLPKVDSGPGVWKFNTSLLKDPEYVSLVSSRKTSLTRQMHQLKRAFDQGDQTAFGKLCEVQQELRGIALHEGHRWALNGPKKERLRLPSS